MNPTVTKTYYRGRKIQVFWCRSHEVWHPYLDGLPIRVTAQNEAGEMHSGIAGFAAAENARDFAKEVIADKQ